MRRQITAVVVAGQVSKAPKSGHLLRDERPSEMGPLAVCPVQSQNVVKLTFGRTNDSVSSRSHCRRSAVQIGFSKASVCSSSSHGGPTDRIWGQSRRCPRP